MKPFVAALMFFILSSCDMLRGNKFEITNNTGHKLEEFQVFFADAGAQRQTLDPGQTLSFRPSPSHDGGISVSYMENGKRIEHDLGYVAPPIPMRCDFQIMSEDIRGDCH